MSSKLVKDGSSGAEDILWRSADRAMHSAAQSAAPAAQPVQPASHGAGHDENQQIAELRRQLQACQHQAESHAQEALKKGVQQGLAQGEANVRQQFGTQQEAALQRLARTIDEISGTRQRCRSAAEQDVVKLALAIARRILHRELAVDPSAILGLVKAALGSLDARELHRVCIHPGQAGPLRLQLEAMGLPQRCEVVADAALERGGAILESNHGTLDASAETQLGEIERGFTDLVRRSTT
jgi:flagellar assembly protein FliH